ncbi:MAG TPA: GNAT family N-acetyltransferase [Spongiibacteraceae bacterium]|nr:GNAT family N-acetyltransferase [Spongiibacteraceae bacterium]
MIEAAFLDDIGRIGAADWNALAGTDYPFTRHEFLSALERSGSVSERSGWTPQHLLLRRDAKLVAVMPVYVKSHSYGENVFDWSWAEAYQRHGMNYYPKLVAAIPFTPATGPRLCVAEGESRAALTRVAAQALLTRAEALSASSTHVLFPDLEASAQWQDAGFSCRWGAQYHWFNQGFASFDAFLETFSARKRKTLRRERRIVAEQGVELEVLSGPRLREEHWAAFYRFYQLTYAKRSGHGGYLTPGFFAALASDLADQVVMVLARQGGEYVAGALNLRSSDTLYGRYWGCTRELDCLHFEACYYQGIDYCIAHGLKRFDPGAQGEHKIQRGFTPIKTYSNHWIAHPGFRSAIDRVLVEEQGYIEEYLVEAATMLPFKSLTSDV